MAFVIVSALHENRTNAYSLAGRYETPQAGLQTIVLWDSYKWEMCATFFGD